METSTSSSNNNNISSSSSSTTTTSELFICFTSRLSSSMKLTSSSNSSKSLLSPARSSQISLSSSLSRRLAPGQASPMFPSAVAVSKKRSGCAAFDANPEPSSPKVTCIGQVRVKTKSKKKKNLHTNNNSNIVRSRSSSSTHHHHRRSLPPPPPTPPPASSEEASFRKNTPPKKEQESNKWMICEALRSVGAELNCFLSPCLGKQDDNIPKVRSEIHRRDEEITAEETKTRVEAAVVVERSGSLKRRVFEGIEFRDQEVEEYNNNNSNDTKARVSLCVPPKNALLLMRCRSDPVKMAALASRFWDSPSATSTTTASAVVDSLLFPPEEEENEKEKKTEQEEENEIIEKIEQVFDVMEAVVLVEDESKNSLVEEQEDQEDQDDDYQLKILFGDDEVEEEEEEEEKEDDICENGSSESQVIIKEIEDQSQTLPDCLLLMMCEPKLSMEVSKETWVCTTDFVRWLPDRRRHAKKPPPPPQQPPQPPIQKKLLPPSPAKVAVVIQPPRSSCSAVTSAVEMRLAGKPYEPVVLPRCKSEPMRSAAAHKLAAAAAAAPQESCLWKNMKLEPHHHRLGVGGGAAGVGF